MGGERIVLFSGFPGLVPASAAFRASLAIASPAKWRQGAVRCDSPTQKLISDARHRDATSSTSQRLATEQWTSRSVLLHTSSVTSAAHKFIIFLLNLIGHQTNHYIFWVFQCGTDFSNFLIFTNTYIIRMLYQIDRGKPNFELCWVKVGKFFEMWVFCVFYC